MSSDKDWILTASGKRFWPLDPREEDVCVEDIAHALSLVCRFTGHVRKHYSVAQHSFHVSQVCNPADALWGLLHDASEAYLADVARPVKHHPSFAFYREAEARLERCICRRFGLPEEMPASVKVADQRMLYTEKRDLLPPVDPTWESTFDTIAREPPVSWRAIPWEPGFARAMFLARYELLTKGA